VLYRALRRLDYKGRFVLPGEMLDLSGMTAQNRIALEQHEAISPVLGPPIEIFEVFAGDIVKMNEGGVHDLIDIIIMGAERLRQIVGPAAEGYIEFAKKQLEGLTCL